MLLLALAEQAEILLLGEELADVLLLLLRRHILDILEDVLNLLLLHLLRVLRLIRSRATG